MTEFVRTLIDLLASAVAEAKTPRTALQLSGGLDSSILQSIGSFKHLYCVTWPELDNITMARVAAGGRPVREVTFSREEMIEIAVPAVAAITRGRGTWSQCCQWFLARAMVADGMVAEVNGEGSDELFAGYSRYRILWWYEKMLLDPHLDEYHGIIEQVLGTPREVLIGMLSRAMPEADAARHVDEQISEMDERPIVELTKLAAAIDERVGLAELLGFEQDIAVDAGLEHRWPFMDRRVVDFAHALPEQEKLTAIESKAILREVARAVGVPLQIVDEVTKRGLVVPPTWAPGGERKWSRGWFTAMMEDAWHRASR